MLYSIYSVVFEVCDEWSEWTCTAECQSHGPYTKTRTCSTNSSLLLGEDHGERKLKEGVDGMCYNGNKCPSWFKLKSQEGCPKGMWGETPRCKKQCPKNCFQIHCNMATGHCRGCTRGYKGLKCDEPCQKGWFGRNCAKKCAMFCQSEDCDSRTGECYGDNCFFWVVLNLIIWIFGALPVWAAAVHAWFFYGNNDTMMWP